MDDWAPPLLALIALLGVVDDKFAKGRHHAVSPRPCQLQSDAAPFCFSSQVVRSGFPLKRGMVPDPLLPLI